MNESKVMMEGGASRGAVYAGTFDPMTKGHLDVAERAARTFSPLIIAVAAMPKKHLMFSVEERVALAKACLAHLPNVQVMPFDGLLVDWTRQHGIHVIIRGLRAFSDFEYEFQMALTNRRLAPDLETYFLMPAPSFSFVSSSMVREIAELHGDVDPFAPPVVAKALRERYPLGAGKS